MLQRVVALKVMAPQLATTASARARFIREARAAAAVAHEHVVMIHAVDESSPLPYIVMQCVEGTSLEEKLNKLGVEAAAVHSHSPKGKREKMVTAFRERRLPIMISVAMFDTGFNVVDIDMLAFCRATKSPVFFAQALGRGARITPRRGRSFGELEHDRHQHEHDQHDVDDSSLVGIECTGTVFLAVDLDPERLTSDRQTWK